MTQRAIGLADAKAKLSPRDYRFHFFPWWQEPGYRIDIGDVPMSAKDDEYFEQVEAETGTTLEPAQRRWYVATREADFSGRSEEHTSELQSLMRISYAVFCLKKKINTYSKHTQHTQFRKTTSSHHALSN